MVISARAPTIAQGLPAPTAIVTIGSGDNEQRVDVSQFFTQTSPGVWALPTQIIPVGDTGSGGSISVSAAASQDPFLTYAFGVVNPFPVATPFGFIFSSPITPLPAGSIVTNHLTGGLTDSDNPAGGDGVTINPFLFSKVADATINGVSAGIPVGDAQTSGPPNGSYTYGPAAGFNASIVSPVAITSLDAEVSFTLTGNLDAAALTGEVTAVIPEPGAVAMFIGLGMSGSLVMLRRVRRR
jgi:hypothetical protein